MSSSDLEGVGATGGMDASIGWSRGPTTGVLPISSYEYEYAYEKRCFGRRGVPGISARARASAPLADGVIRRRRDALVVLSEDLEEVDAARERVRVGDGDGHGARRRDGFDAFSARREVTGRRTGVEVSIC